MTDPNTERTLLQKAYDDALNSLLNCDAATDEYDRIFKKVQALKSMLDCDKSEPWRPSPDAVVKTAGLVGTSLIIVLWESRNAWTTKAGPFLMKFF